MNTYLKLFFALFAMPCAYAVSYAHAAEIKVVDGSGLVRVLGTVATQATIEADVQKPLSSGENLILRHVDGLAPDIVGRNNDHTYSFSGVSAGMWRLDIDGGKTAVMPRVKDIRIIETVPPKR